MAASPQQRHVEALLAEAGWVRSIARRLVPDSHAAEDVAQDTLVAALEAKSDLGAGGPGDLRSWLGAVGRNLSLRRVRREAQRRDVERAVARDEATAGVEGVAERMELQRRLAEAILALEEPYRSAVVLRYLDGLAPEAIAERLEITNANARQRVSRGIAMLRARLDRELGARALWAVPLARLAEQGHGTGALTAGAGVGAAIMGSKVVLGGAVAAAVLATAWVANRPEEVHGEDYAVSTPHEVAAPEALSPGSAPFALDAPAPSPGERRIASAEPVGARASELVIVGHASDLAGRPLAGLSVEPCGADGSPSEEWPEGGHSDSTDREGLFRVTSRDGSFPTHVRLESEVYLPRVVAVPEASPWEVVLEARPVIEGRVLDPDGDPIGPPGTITVAVRAELEDGSGGFEAHIQSDGTYRISGLPVGRWTMTSTQARGFPLQHQRADQELTSGSLHKLDLVLEPGLVVHGVVLDEATREPVPFAKVWGDVEEYESDPFAPSTVTDSEGRFRLSGFKRTPVEPSGHGFNVFFLAAASPEHGASPLSLVTRVPDERGEYEVVLLLSSRLATFTARVFEPDGTTPAVGVTFMGIDALDKLATQTTDEFGKFTTEGLTAGPLSCLFFRRERGPSGLHESWAGSIELDHDFAAEQRIVLEADLATEIAGRVIDAQGAPVSGVEVEAQHFVSSGTFSFGLQTESTTTDADGRYRFTGMRAGDYRVRIAGCTSPADRGLDLVTGERSSADFIALDCMTIKGWVELGDTLAAQLGVRLFAVDERWVADTEVSADGSFELPDIIVDSYEVVLFRDDQRLDHAPVDASSPTGIVLRVP